MVEVAPQYDANNITARAGAEMLFEILSLMVFSPSRKRGMNGNLFARLAEGFPDDRAGAFLETADGAAVSFADLLERAGRIAALLRASRGRARRPGGGAGREVGRRTSASTWRCCRRARSMCR